MADADEDLIPRSQPSNISTNTDPTADPEDEAQDFRFLASLTSKSNSASTLPRRGEKDFEPNPTQAQSNTLAASREAMHNALAAERVLPPHNLVVGQYLPDPVDWRWDVLSPEEHGTTGGKGGRCVVVEKFRTTYARSVGVADHRNWTWLLPEEALFLLERGTLDVRWPDDTVKKLMKSNRLGGGGEESGENDVGSEDEAGRSDREGSDTEEADTTVRRDHVATMKTQRHNVNLQVGEMPMSLQGAYASFIGKSGLSLERYNVYAGLRRLGYIVQRASTWNEGEIREEEGDTNGYAPEPDGHLTQPLIPVEPISKPQTQALSSATSLINRLVAYLYTPKPLHYHPTAGPLIYPGLYRNYSDIFRALTIIPHYTPLAPHASTIKTSPKPPYTISWHVYKPSPNTQFRKSNPPPPDFRIAVLDARTTSIPTASEIGALLESMPTDELPKEKRMEQRLKYGVRNVILAVVDSGLVSYLRLADVCSGSEGKVFETKAAKGGKRGGVGWKRGGGAGAGASSGRGGKK